MFPERGEALNRTIEFEAALAEVYMDVLNGWVAHVRPLVLPSLTAAGELPPDPAALDQNAGALDQPSGELILAVLATLWALSLVETSEALEISLPELPDLIPQLPREVLRPVTSTSDLSARRVREAVAVIEADDDLRMARDDFIETQRERVESVPALVREKVEAAVAEARPAAPEGEPEITVSVEQMTAAQREAAAAVLSPGSPELREVARYEGYQAAGVQNAAVIAAAARSEDELDKVWIATIDGKTRPTHFAADGQRAPLAGTFSIGNEPLRYPGDPAGPAKEVRNCRCRVGVLALDEDIPDEIDRHTERLGGRDSVQINREGSQADEIERRARNGTVRARDDEDGVGRTAAGGWIAPSDQEYDMPKPAAPTTGPATATLAAEETEGELFRTFTDQPIAFVGIETSDGRMLAADIDLSFRTFPLPVMWVKQTGYGHEDAYTVGVIESARIDGERVLGSGYILNTPEADEAAGLLEHTATRPSVDLARTEWRLVDEDGNEITEEQWWDMPMDAKIIQQITAAELIGTTLVATPAFGDTMIALNAERESRDAALVAAAADEFRPRVYSASFFANPGLTEPTQITMDDSGHIFGHLACFGSCHRSIQAACVMAPRSPSDYSMFHTSPAVRLDDGTSIPVGRLTVGTGHAPDSYAGAPAKAHYDNTGTCFALVRAGEDEHGIWVSGVAAPWATPEQIEEGLAAPLSGDWRDFGRGLDLIAALAVNTPGFAVRGRSGAEGQPVALVASLGPDPRSTPRSEALSAEAIGSIVEQAVARAYAKRETDAELAGLMAAANEKVGPPPAPKSQEDELAELLARAGSLS
ncbi:portal protein [Mycobacterium phage Quesadilla]|uniref:Capsid maturation protease and MuF-like fusion protein n=1 Tax=Mycobacterium phage Quesadilla TaxID=2664226 RepID=A0A5Q2WCY4_9CAUD|nr:portal protein [Mycobacterium phage Quesadilla]QGH75260.1 capsid maturation protease and MuF-like fusion protein [Mycobacterium phage Quesadilla]